jgi:phage baseplate assembly protein W
MTTFIGFNTQNQYKKFTLVDFELIKRDLLNALNIRQGQLVGRPAYGTRIWDYVFESQVQETQAGMEREIQRVCGGDPRIFVQSINAYPQENGMLLELLISVVPSTNAERLAIFFDQEQRTASYV